MKRIAVPRIDAIIFDLDGTAVNHGSIYPSSRVIHTVQAVAKQKHVSLATGRSLETGVESIIDIFQLTSECIVAGGSQIYHPMKKQIVWEVKIDPDIVRSIVGITKLYPYGLLTQNHKDMVTPAQVQKEQITRVCILDVPMPDATKILSELDRISGIMTFCTPAWHCDGVDISITHELATKKHAVQVLLAKEHIDHKHVLAVGDGGNDLPLFELAGWKVAMGNASQELKSAADWIAPTVDEDGLAVAIEKFAILSHQ